MATIRSTDVDHFATKSGMTMTSGWATWLPRVGPSFACNQAANGSCLRPCELECRSPGPLRVRQRKPTVRYLRRGLTNSEVPDAALVEASVSALAIFRADFRSSHHTFVSSARELALAHIL